jgi:hypothetical protein
LMFSGTRSSSLSPQSSLITPFLSGVPSPVQKFIPS